MHFFPWGSLINFIINSFITVVTLSFFTVASFRILFPYIQLAFLIHSLGCLTGTSDCVLDCIFHLLPEPTPPQGLAPPVDWARAFQIWNLCLSRVLPLSLSSQIQSTTRCCWFYPRNTSWIYPLSIFAVVSCISVISSPALQQLLLAPSSPLSSGS